MQRTILPCPRAKVARPFSVRTHIIGGVRLDVCPQNRVIAPHFFTSFVRLKPMLSLSHCTSCPVLWSPCLFSSPLIFSPLFISFSSLFSLLMCLSFPISMCCVPLSASVFVMAINCRQYSFSIDHPPSTISDLPATLLPSQTTRARIAGSSACTMRLSPAS